jgi:MFS family permease
VGHLTTAVAVLLWGKYSDGHGRKPVLLSCSAGLAIAITCFGFSKTYQALIVCKFLEGCFKANKPTVKTSFAEISEGDESRMAKAFALMPVVYAAGAAAG